MSLLRTAQSSPRARSGRFASLRANFENGSIAETRSGSNSILNSNGSTEATANTDPELIQIVRNATSQVLKTGGGIAAVEEEDQSMQSYMRTLSGSSGSSSFSVSKAFNAVKRKMNKKKGASGSSVGSTPPIKQVRTGGSGASNSTKTVELGGNLQMDFEHTIPIDHVEVQNGQKSVTCLSPKEIVAKKRKKEANAKAEKLLRKMDEQQKMKIATAKQKKLDAARKQKKLDDERKVPQNTKKTKIIRVKEISEDKSTVASHASVDMIPTASKLNEKQKLLARLERMGVKTTVVARMPSPKVIEPSALSSPKAADPPSALSSLKAADPTGHNASSQGVADPSGSDFRDDLISGSSSLSRSNEENQDPTSPRSEQTRKATNRATARSTNPFDDESSDRRARYTFPPRSASKSRNPKSAKRFQEAAALRSSHNPFNDDGDDNGDDDDMTPVSTNSPFGDGGAADIAMQMLAGGTTNPFEDEYQVPDSTRQRVETTNVIGDVEGEDFEEESYEVMADVGGEDFEAFHVDQFEDEDVFEGVDMEEECDDIEEKEEEYDSHSCNDYDDGKDGEADDADDMDPRMIALASYDDGSLESTPDRYSIEVPIEPQDSLDDLMNLAAARLATPKQTSSSSSNVDTAMGMEDIMNMTSTRLGSSYVDTAMGMEDITNMTSPRLGISRFEQESPSFGGGGSTSGGEESSSFSFDHLMDFAAGRLGSTRRGSAKLPPTDDVSSPSINQKIKNSSTRRRETALRKSAAAPSVKQDTTLRGARPPPISTDLPSIFGGGGSTSGEESSSFSFDHLMDFAAGRLSSTSRGSIKLPSTDDVSSPSMNQKIKDSSARKRDTVPIKSAAAPYVRQHTALHGARPPPIYTDLPPIELSESECSDWSEDFFVETEEEVVFIDLEAEEPPRPESPRREAPIRPYGTLLAAGYTPRSESPRREAPMRPAGTLLSPSRLYSKQTISPPPREAFNHPMPMSVSPGKSLADDLSASLAPSSMSGSTSAFTKEDLEGVNSAESRCDTYLENESDLPSSSPVKQQILSPTSSVLCDALENAVVPDPFPLPIELAVTSTPRRGDFQPSPKGRSESPLHTLLASGFCSMLSPIVEPEPHERSPPFSTVDQSPNGRNYSLSSPQASLSNKSPPLSEASKEAEKSEANKQQTGLKAQESLLGDDDDYWDTLSSMATGSGIRSQKNFEAVTEIRPLSPVAEISEGDGCICPWNEHIHLPKNHPDYKGAHGDVALADIISQGSGDTFDENIPNEISYLPDDLRLSILPKEPQLSEQHSENASGSLGNLQSILTQSSSSSSSESSSVYIEKRSEDANVIPSKSFIGSISAKVAGAELQEAIKRGEDQAFVDSPQPSDQDHTFVDSPKPSRQRYNSKAGDDNDADRQGPPSLPLLLQPGASLSETRGNGNGRKVSSMKVEKHETSSPIARFEATTKETQEQPESLDEPSADAILFELSQQLTQQDESEIGLLQAVDESEKNRIAVVEMNRAKTNSLNIISQLLSEDNSEDTQQLAHQDESEIDVLQAEILTVDENEKNRIAMVEMNRAKTNSLNISSYLSEDTSEDTKQLAHEGEIEIGVLQSEIPAVDESEKNRIAMVEMNRAKTSSLNISSYLSEDTSEDTKQLAHEDESEIGVLQSEMPAVDESEKNRIAVVEMNRAKTSSLNVISELLSGESSYDTDDTHDLLLALSRSADRTDRTYQDEQLSSPSVDHSDDGSSQGSIDMDLSASESLQGASSALSWAAIGGTAKRRQMKLETEDSTINVTPENILMDETETTPLELLMKESEMILSKSLPEMPLSPDSQISPVKQKEKRRDGFDILVGVFPDTSSETDGDDLSPGQDRYPSPEKSCSRSVSPQKKRQGAPPRPVNTSSECYPVGDIEADEDLSHETMLDLSTEKIVIVLSEEVNDTPLEGSRDPSGDFSRRPSPEKARYPSPERARYPAPEKRQPLPEKASREKSPEKARYPSPEKKQPSPAKALREQSPEKVRYPSIEKRQPSPERAPREQSPEKARYSSPEKKQSVSSPEKSRSSSPEKQHPSLEKAGCLSLEKARYSSPAKTKRNEPLQTSSTIGNHATTNLLQVTSENSDRLRRNLTIQTDTLAPAYSFDKDEHGRKIVGRSPRLLSVLARLETRKQEKVAKRSKGGPLVKETLDEYDTLVDQLVRQNKTLKQGGLASDAALGADSEAFKECIVDSRVQKEMALNSTPRTSHGRAPPSPENRTTGGSFFFPERTVTSLGADSEGPRERIVDLGVQKERIVIVDLRVQKEMALNSTPRTSRGRAPPSPESSTTGGSFSFPERAVSPRMRAVSPAPERTISPRVTAVSLTPERTVSPRVTAVSLTPERNAPLVTCVSPTLSGKSSLNYRPEHQRAAPSTPTSSIRPPRPEECFSLESPRRARSVPQSRPVLEETEPVRATYRKLEKSSVLSYSEQHQEVFNKSPRHGQEEKQNQQIFRSNTVEVRREDAYQRQAQEVIRSNPVEAPSEDKYQQSQQQIFELSRVDQRKPSLPLSPSWEKKKPAAPKLTTPKWEERLKSSTPISSTSRSSTPYMDRLLQERGSRPAFAVRRTFPAVERESRAAFAVRDVRNPSPAVERESQPTFAVRDVRNPSPVVERESQPAFAVRDVRNPSPVVRALPSPEYGRRREERNRGNSPHRQVHDQRESAKCISSPERRRLLGNHISDQTKQLKRDLARARLSSHKIRNEQADLSSEMQTFKRKLSQHTRAKRGERTIMAACQSELGGFQQHIQDTRQEISRNDSFLSEMTLETAWDDFSEIRGAMLTNLKLMRDAQESLINERFRVNEELDDDSERLREIQDLMDTIQEQEKHGSEMVRMALQDVGRLG